jgi:hypothetical protein
VFRSPGHNAEQGVPSDATLLPPRGGGLILIDLGSLVIVCSTVTLGCHMAERGCGDGLNGRRYGQGV